ncbi:DUF1850 domain-containing protein [Thalassospira sp. HF15]|uniref:DUF1850 domain-containing protein n=1 Tax=Thalassospira sp. HF15 TaxID=2722755 RepID=UPI0014305222|nr:DUF1850 domain-containing protein [Thalassospira sp. HF15]NIY74787.1 DUF1850 domain-containing protein [Thalassospira sp. HF15]
MILNMLGRPVLAALLLLTAACAGPTYQDHVKPGTVIDHLEVIGEDGSLLARTEIPRQTGWCLYWNHSVTGDGVIDCYVDDLGKMVLHRAYQPDFAAGLGHYPGRGILTSAEGGGYWIEDIDEPVRNNAYVLRVGSLAVNHRIVTDRDEINLSKMAEHTRVTIRLDTEE